nr:MAG: capsid protein [Canine parvovirus]
MPPLNKAKKSGLTLPGYNYLGPFNSLFNGKPTNKADEAARKHDFGYSDLLREGKNPYLYFNKHDQTFLDDLKDDYSFGGLLGKAVFKIKQAVAPSLGDTNKSAKIDRAAKRKLYFARSNKGAKKANMENTSADNNPDLEPDQQPDPAMAESRSVGSMGGGGKGGAGVGYSTGGWTGGTIFTENAVVTKNTRQFICDIKNGHLYKTVSINNSGEAFPQYGCTTPWSYFNFNQYSSHFSPNDWQKLVNEYVRFRPQKMRVKVYNLQIKQIVTDGAQGTTYNNDLTAGMHIFCDGSHSYPYVQMPWDEGCMPENPTEVWVLQQYAYLYAPYHNVDDMSQSLEGKLLRGVPLYMLENSDHEVLRTGEATEFTYSFGDCEWVENDIAYQMPQMMYNPLVKTRKVFSANRDGTQWMQQNGALKTGTWLPGPGIPNARTVVNPLNLSAGPLFVATANYDNTDGAYDSRAYSSGPIHGALAAYSSDAYLHYLPDDGGVGADNNVFVQDYKHTFTRDYEVAKNVNPDASSPAIANDWFMLPNQVWDSPSVGRYHPIWVKVPRVNRKTMFDTNDGTIPLEHPPGTIFLKLAKIPIPGNSNSFLNIYVTGQVSCEILWQAEKRGTKNWRPEFKHSVETMDRNSYKVDTNGKYLPALADFDTMQTRWGNVKTL